MDPVFAFLAGMVIGAALYAAVGRAIRKASGGYFLRDGEAIADEAVGMDSPGD